MIADVSGPTFAPTVLPLDLEGVPATATPGSDVAVTVVEYRSATGSVGEGERSPVAGATVSGGAAPVTTGADGKATVRLGPAGSAVLKATKAPDAPSAGERVTVSAAAPQAAGGAPVPAAGAAPDRAAPTATLAGLRDDQVLTRGPRELRGRFADASGVKAVKLRLTKRLGRKCWYFSGKHGALPRHAVRARAVLRDRRPTPTGPTCCPRG